ncbi:MAG: RAMP superfamily CRISPR-associated protein [Scytonema sp. PMC 1069.18]|nr:RAMP superfamily CRISPR-associated protein [Scytonema sp. PMC 1069.18]MEC4880462.1 RAMP superfamily CRISPR-associated protein [Scytonema sp. PMC 1070.18]
MSCDRINIRNQRQVLERIIIKGNLILDTPTCFGSGDNDSDVDIEILRDSIEDKALLMGSSIAGALRNDLREHNNGYGVTDDSILFGGQRSDEDGEQSPLVVNDALSNDVISLELRDGVKINNITKTADDGAKYDLEFLESGTKFNLYFELLIDKESNKEQLIRELIVSLQGLEAGKIRLGIKKNRGFGCCHVEKWQVWQFDLENHKQRIEWLIFPHWETGVSNNYQTHNNIADALGVTVVAEDKRQHLTIQATFTLASPLLIRSGQASTDKAPDVVHLKSRRNGEAKPILSGTSLTGVLRHRAERIVNTIQNNTNIINEIFGFVDENTKKANASRLIVDEVEINDTTDLVQNRIAIDRFTGGALDGALFNEQPIFGNNKTKLTITLQLRQPKEPEIGLLLLLLKDLWTGDLTVGGTSSIGRGRLKGENATIQYGEKNWKIVQNSNNKDLTIDNPDELEQFVAALHQEVTP